MPNSAYCTPTETEMIVEGNDHGVESNSSRLPFTMDRVSIDGKFFKRSQNRLCVQGVTYGPFGLNLKGEPFPSIERVKSDFEMMRGASINSIRTYHVPSPWLLDLACENQLSVMVDVPWEKHLCFLDSPRAQSEARKAIHHAVVACRNFPNLFAYSIGNEIPTNIVRWHGAKRIERFLAEMVDTVKQADSNALATYANYPSTEYLDLSACDFITFNVYLHHRDVFRSYLHRLQNIVGDKPLLLGELGMDTLRNGEIEQADFLSGHLRESMLLGVAGSFVFSWSDDWETGGHAIENWAFGITDRERAPKASYHAIGEVYGSVVSTLLKKTPKVSVVVCTYNGGATLWQCLDSLKKIEYPDFEVIVVDDGSTDNTKEVLERFQEFGFTIIRQANRGLSAARNAGLYNASGTIIAYVDSDCFVDRDWLSLLVAQLEQSGAAAVGGPNLSPEDGWMAACVGASPGQPTHVLVSDQVAEHIPGCNMAFRRDALLAIHGFNEKYRKAGDDVDICWRLEHEGHWITFAPGAFVWHHRRQTPRAYFRQQAGYGEAEAMLRFQHPNRFNERGEGKWNGVIYGDSLSGLCLESPIIYRGRFGTGMFQCVYQPPNAHWAMLPSTLEWHLVAAGSLLAFPVWNNALILATAMWSFSLIVAALQAVQAKIPVKHDGIRSRLMVMFLCYAQPLVRSWHRQKTRLFGYRRPSRTQLKSCDSKDLPCSADMTVEYWVEDGSVERTDLLDRLIAELQKQSWRTSVDTGWTNWDLEVYCHFWTMVRIASVQEEHGQGKRLIRVRCQKFPSGYMRMLTMVAALFGLIGLLFWSVPYALAAAILFLSSRILYSRGTSRTAWVVAQVDEMAQKMGMVRCPPAHCRKE